MEVYNADSFCRSGQRDAIKDQLFSYVCMCKHVGPDADRALPNG